MPEHARYVPLIESGAQGIAKEVGAKTVAAVSSNNMTDSREYSKAISKLNSDMEVIEVHGHRLPSFVEELALGTADMIALRKEIARVLTAVPQHTDILVHACTHFPFLDGEFAAQRPNLKRVSSVDYQAAIVQRMLGQRASHGNNESVFLTTGNASDFSRQVSNLLNIKKPKVFHIDDYGKEAISRAELNSYWKYCSGS